MINKLTLIALLLITLNACTKDEQPDTTTTVRPITDNSSPFISKIFEYLPAPGQFINEDGLGTLAGAQALIGNKDNLVSLGGYGGYIVFGFDHSILNSAGYDIAIYGNAIGGINEWSEPGIVMVSQDKNGNGLPDDDWYELAGSQYDSSSTLKNYSITYYNPKAKADVPWKDNQGNTGAVLNNASHDHPYYPAFAANQDSITFKGTLLRNTFRLAEGSGIYINPGFAWGYSDNYSAQDNYPDNHYNSFDISQAVDASGQKVSLAAVDFVKVYTGQNSPGNTLLGEISTDVGAAADLHMN
jgi:hypothetical protein